MEGLPPRIIAKRHRQNQQTVALITGWPRHQHEIKSFLQRTIWVVRTGSGGHPTSQRIQNAKGENSHGGGGFGTTSPNSSRCFHFEKKATWLKSLLGGRGKEKGLGKPLKKTNKISGPLVDSPTTGKKNRGVFGGSPTERLKGK